MTSYTIDYVGTPPAPRVTSSQKLDAEQDFERIAGDVQANRGKIIRARKISFVSARRASAPETFMTMIEGRESPAKAEAGDWVVTNMNAQGNILRDSGGLPNSYVIKAEDFARLYDRHSGATEFGEVYKAKGVVDAIALPGGFDIVAPWGERQSGTHGYLVRNGKDVYGIHGGAFDQTYEVVG